MPCLAAALAISLSLLESYIVYNLLLSLYSKFEAAIAAPNNVVLLDLTSHSRYPNRQLPSLLK
jgi:hypothetical protein